MIFFNKIAGPGSLQSGAVTVAGMIVIYAMAIIILIFARPAQTFLLHIETLIPKCKTVCTHTRNQKKI